MEKTRVLLAGIGGYGSLYLNELLDAKDPSFVFAGAADPFAASSPRFGELGKRDIPVFNTPEEFFASGGKAELSVISSPIHTHYPYTITCFENRSNVLCEKPVTGDLARLDDLIDREEKSGLFCAVGFQFCFAPDTLALKKDIMDGVFGKPLDFKCYEFPVRGDKYYSRNNWAAKLVIEGETILDSPLNNACSHDLQLMLFLSGNDMKSSAEVISVEAELWQARPEIENFDAAALKAVTKDGVTLHFYTAHCIEADDAGPYGEFRFENALIRWEEKKSSGFTACFNDGRIKSYKELHKDNILQKFYQSLETINSGMPPLCTLKTVRDHLKCVVEAGNFPVRKIPREKVIYDKTANPENPHYSVPDLGAALLRSYKEGVLPSETGFKI